MKKHVICFTDSLGSGGAQRQMVGLARMLKKRGYEVSVVLYHDMPFYKPLLDEMGIESHVVRSSSYIGRIWAMYKYFRKNKGSTIIAYQETPSLIACLLRPFIRCSKLITSERNTTQTITKTDKIRFWLYRFADHIVPNSYTQATFISEHYPNLRRKITTITNFVDTEYFRPLDRASDAKSRTNTIIVVGSHKPQKNFHRFVNAIKILRDEGINLRIKWYGIFPEHIDSHKAYVESLNLNSVISIYGPSQDIRSVYQSADFLCLPSIFEGFPNALCEAMSCGLPIACSDVCDNPYIVRAGLNGFLFDPYKPVEIAKAIISLTNLTIEERQKISQINRRCAEENFALESFINKYVEIIG